MNDPATATINPENLWRLNTPGVDGWAKDVRPDSDNKYYMVSVDTHMLITPDIFLERIDRKFIDRLPRMEKRGEETFVLVEGIRPQRVSNLKLEGEDLLRSKSGSHITAGSASAARGITASDRVEDQEADGVDGEVIFPNGIGLSMTRSPDPDFVQAQTVVWNDWAIDVCKPHLDRCNPVAVIATRQVEWAVSEVERVAKLGYRVVQMPCKPIPGPREPDHINYNLPVFDPLWAAIQDHDLAVTFHIGADDPRTARGNGGAVINYSAHALPSVIEPIVSLCSSGVFDRFPKLRAGSIEANAGWIPWIMQSMDEAYKKHHMWVSPKLKSLPSEAFREHCFASFGEDRAAVLLAGEYGLEDNLCWANDYPHHEGSWPHSAEAIERTMRDTLDETSRAKMLGLNAARIFRFDVPTRYR